MVKKPKYLNGTNKHLALISPLDWGLGHTTRCIPIIRELQLNNFEIVIACDTTQKLVLYSEFPDLTFENFPGYGLKYGKTRAGTLLRLVSQVKYILTAIKREKRLLKELSDRYHPDLIMSDNRYGFILPGVRSIIITHQLNLITGFGKIANRFVNRFIRKYVSQFDECWVPDFQGEHSLAGKLSDRGEVNDRTFFIGPLSRFEACASETLTIEDNLLVILSGPEPQRTVLEQKLLKELAILKNKTVFVRGTNTGPDINPIVPAGIQIIDLASAKQLNRLICDAGIVICRTGYTSVMDLMKLRKKMIMIPTPGQAEQEYLGKYLAAKKFAIVLNQEKIELGGAIKQAQQLVPPQLPPMDLYKQYCKADHLVKD